MAKASIQHVSEEKIQELRDTIKKLGIKEPTRQHGRQGVVLADEEQERIRLYKNLSSIIYRAKKRAMMKAVKENGRETSGNKELSDADIYAVDVRRFKQCFIWEYMPPTMSYVRTMTGLNDYQIMVLEKYTGMNVMHKPEDDDEELTNY